MDQQLQCAMWLKLQLDDDDEDDNDDVDDGDDVDGDDLIFRNLQIHIKM